MIKIFSGPIRSGKTTRLFVDYGFKDVVGGFLTPDVDNKRMLYSLSKDEYFPFEQISDSENELVEIGKFKFLQSSFDLGIAIIEEDLKNEDIKTIIVDEIGKLEMKDLGFHPILELIKKTQKEVILVVRDTLVDKVKEKYKIK